MNETIHTAQMDLWIDSR